MNDQSTSICIKTIRKKLFGIIIYERETYLEENTLKAFQNLMGVMK